MEPVESFKSSTSRGDEAEAVELLDEYWFFKNLLHRKVRMFRSSSDPYPSSKSIEETYDDIKSSQQCSSSINVPKENALVRQSIHRTPSLPPSIGRKEAHREKESARRTSKLTRQTSLCAPNVLPQPWIGREEADSAPESARRMSKLSHQASCGPDVLPQPWIGREEEDSAPESARRMGKLSRQASLCAPNVLPQLQVGREEADREKESTRRTSKLTRQGSLCAPNVLPQPRTPKMTTPNPGIPKHQARKELKIDRTTKSRNQSTTPTKGVMSRSLSQKVSPKSRSELECEEVQGFKDLGFVFDKEVLSPSVLNIIPGLQSKKPVDWNDRVSRPYLSEAWLVQRSTPPMPDWINGGSVGDVKAQLKFWARAVASNVQQEC